MDWKPLRNYKLEQLRKSITFKKSYVVALQKRLALARKDFATKSEYERNEIDITCFQTQSAISNSLLLIKEKELACAKELCVFYSDLEELSQNYKQTIDLAKKFQSDTIGLKHLLYHADWKYVEENIDEKINLYKNLKEYIK